MGRPKRTFEEREHEFCYPEPNTGCWLWAGAIDESGYGFMRDERTPGISKSSKAHRLFYERYVGPIPDGLVLDHLCRTPSCVNPDHLEPVTNEENIRRGFGAWAVNSRKVVCKNGHPLHGDNLVMSGHGTRRCLTCRLEYMKLWQREYRKTDKYRDYAKKRREGRSK